MIYEPFRHSVCSEKHTQSNFKVKQVGIQDGFQNNVYLTTGKKLHKNLKLRSPNIFTGQHDKLKQYHYNSKNNGSVCLSSHLGFDVLRILSLAVSLLAGLPGILCLFQVHVFFHGDCDDLPGFSSLARLRSPWSDIQQLGQGYSSLHLHSALTTHCPCYAAQLKPDDHTKHIQMQR